MICIGKTKCTSRKGLLYLPLIDFVFSVHNDGCCAFICFFENNLFVVNIKCYSVVLDSQLVASEHIPKDSPQLQAFSSRCKWNDNLLSRMFETVNNTIAKSRGKYNYNVFF